jgi:CheY-like chemotaxis protein
MEGHPRILLADDDASIRRLLEAVLRKEGYEVESVINGSQAVDKLRSETYSLVLLDLMMPVMNGFEVLYMLDRDERLRAVHVVILSAASPREIEAAGGVFVCQVLQKPFEVDDLIRAVHRCVDRSSRNEHAKEIELPL